MLALLRKDLYVMKSYILLYGVVWAIVVGMLAWIPDAAGSPPYFILPLLLATIATSSIDADERWRWDGFAAVTPLGPGQVVAAKYLLAYGVVAMSVGIGALAGWASTLGKSGLDMRPAAGLMLLVTATWLPPHYRFGRSLGYFCVIALWGVWALLLLNPLGLEIAGAVLKWMEDAPDPVPGVSVMLALAGLNAGSAFLSVRFYTRRRRGCYD